MSPVDTIELIAHEVEHVIEQLEPLLKFSREPK